MVNVLVPTRLSLVLSGSLIEALAVGLFRGVVWPQRTPSYWYRIIVRGNGHVFQARFPFLLAKSMELEILGTSYEITCISIPTRMTEHGLRLDPGKPIDVWVDPV